MLGASTAAAERAVAVGPRWEPTGALIPIMRQLPAEMVYLSVSDPRVGTPVLSMALPVLVRQINAEIALGERRLGKVPKDVYLRLDPEIIPPVEDLNRRLFPSSTTITVDRGGASLTHREAIPTISSPAVGAGVIARCDAVDSVGPRSGATGQVRGQSQADRSGDAQLPFREQYLPTGGKRRR